MSKQEDELQGFHPKDKPEAPEWYRFEDERPEWVRELGSGMLSNRDIRRCLEDGLIRIIPTPDSLEKSLQEDTCKVDFHLGNKIRRIKRGQVSEITLGQGLPDDYFEDIEVGEDGVLIRQGDHVVATTAERLVLANFIAARMEGKSSVARAGLMVEQAAVFDAGWDGFPAVELTSLTSIAIRVKPGKSICAFTFYFLTTPATNAYKGQYQHQIGPKYFAAPPSSDEESSLESWLGSTRQPLWIPRNPEKP